METRVQIRFRDENGNIIQARAYEATPISSGATVIFVTTAITVIIILLKSSISLLAL